MHVDSTHNCTANGFLNGTQAEACECEPVGTASSETVRTWNLATMSLCPSAHWVCTLYVCEDVRTYVDREGRGREENPVQEKLTVVYPLLECMYVRVWPSDAYHGLVLVFAVPSSALLCCEVVESS